MPSPAAPPNPPDPAPRARLAAIFGGSVGNLVEWYDWYTYSAFALYFARAFFPAGDQTAQLLQAAGVFALGFLVRPVGGWLMGHYADRFGRRAALTASVLLMSLGSLVIAVTPGYATIGVLSPALLTLARLLQGLSVGGEYGASATYLSEVAGHEHRGFWSSFQYVTLSLGQLLAMGVLLILQRWLAPAELERWGWRVAFALGAAGALVALVLRARLEESAAFVSASREDRTLMASLRALWAHPRAVLTVLGLTAGGTVAFYTFTTYAQKFLVNTAGWPRDRATSVSALALAVFTLVQPVVGWVSDRVGRRPVLMAFGVLGTLGTVPLMSALARARTAGEGLVLLLAALLVVSGYTAINAVVKAELFPTGVRALGVGLPYAVAVSLFGGTAEYLALWAKSVGHERWFYGYVTVLIAGSLAVYATMRETRGARMAEHPEG